MALNQAVKLQLLNSKPTDAVEKPKKSKEEMAVLDSFQVKKLLNRLTGTTLFMPVLLAVTTGARRSEICAFKWSKIDFYSKTLYIDNQLQRNEEKELVMVPTKTKSSKRTITLLDYTIPILKQNYENQNKNKKLLKGKYIHEDFAI